MSGKTIQLNPAFLSMNKRGVTKNHTIKHRSNQGKKEKPVMHNSTNKIKKKLIEKVKIFQNKTIEEENRKNMEASEKKFNNNETKIETEFNKSMSFLEDLSNKRKQKQLNKNQQKNNNHNKNNTLKNGKIEREIHIQTQSEIATELPSELFKIPSSYITSNVNAVIIPTPLSYSTPSIQVEPEPEIKIQPEIQTEPQIQKQKQIQIQPQPLYGSLRNGNLPTFRQWKNQTQKNTNVHINDNKPLIKIEHDDDAEINETNENNIMPERSIILENIKKEYKENKENKEINGDRYIDEEQAEDVIPQITKEPTLLNTPENKEKSTRIKKRITRTKKYTLGKKGGKVSVLIKNAKTRKLVQHELSLLREHSILDVKNYLRRKNLIKVGSDAPNDVLRHLYEQTILSGDIENKGGGILIHNYMSK